MKYTITAHYRGDGPSHGIVETKKTNNKEQACAMFELMTSKYAKLITNGTHHVMMICNNH